MKYLKKADPKVLAQTTLAGAFSNKHLLVASFNPARAPNRQTNIIVYPFQNVSLSSTP